MYKTIQILAQLGQIASVNDYHTVQEMLEEHNISEQQINDLVNSNTPLVCAWIPQDDEQEEDDSDQNDDQQLKPSKPKKH